MNNPSDKTLIKPVEKSRHLVVKIELPNGIIFSLDEDKLPLRIGRGHDCDICLPQSDVSRIHCELFLKNNILFLKDCSTNGTLVGGKRFRGESISIEMATKVTFNEDVMMTITPSGLGGVIEGTDFQSNRSGQDRRHIERRANVYEVDFERRSDDTRRTCQRRFAASA